MKKLFMVIAMFGMLFLTACDMDTDPDDMDPNDNNNNNENTTLNAAVNTVV